MKTKNGFLKRFQLYDTTGLSKTVRKNLMWVLICILFGNVSFSITGGTALTGYVKALGASDFAYSLLLGAPYVAKFMQLITSYVLEKTRARRTLLIWFGIVGRIFQKDPLGRSTKGAIGARGILKLHMWQLRDDYDLLR